MGVKWAVALGIGLLPGWGGGGELPVIPATGEVELPAGVFVLSEPLVVPAGARGLTIRGQGTATVLRAADDFEGSALVALRDADEVTLRGFAIDGNRSALAYTAGLPPSDVPFIDFALRPCCWWTLPGPRRAGSQALPSSGA